MAVYFYSAVGFNSTKLQAKYQNLAMFSAGASTPSVTQFPSSSAAFVPKRPISKRRWPLCLSVADSNRLTTEASETTASSPSDAQLPAVNSSSSGSSASQTSVLDPQTSEAPDGTLVSSNQEEEEEKALSKSRRSPLTARERLRAAKVLSRYTDSKPSKKSTRGKNVLDTLRDSERGKKRSGLPEAPTNMLDDSKRGMPKQGLTWDFPGGADLFLIIFSFVFISTVMFTTTYVVWKLGAIHFNEN